MLSQLRDSWSTLCHAAMRSMDDTYRNLPTETTELCCFIFFGSIIVLVSLMHFAWNLVTCTVFFWQLTRQSPAPPALDQPHANAGIGAPVVAIHPQREKEGKAPMSVELYHRVCRWFVDWGTLDGIFAHTFTILSWNLACHANNTAKIRLKDVEWASTFDAYEKFFAHTKTDQTGKEAKYSRHVYANPMEPLVCPFLTLAFYFSCCLNMQPTANEFIFPGNDQYQRYSKQLYHVLHEHVDEVRLLGFEVADISTHSIRKGAISYLASLPGGPPIAAVCIWVGWTMGNVRDIYMRYISSGDQFVGWCLSMLPLLRTEFGSSPPLFVPTICDWADDYRKMQFSMLTGIAHLSRMTLFCFASLAYHRAFITTNLGPNHVVCTSGPNPSFVMVMHSHMLALVQPLLFHIPGCQVRPSQAFLRM